jgi:HemY protein
VRLVLAIALLALAAGAAAGLFLHDEAGYVLVSFGPWILESSVLGFMLAVLVAILAVVYGAKGLVALLRLPTTVREALAARRQRRAQESFESGLQKLLEGQWARAEVELVRRAADHHQANLNYLMAARAAQRAGAPQRRDQYLALAAGPDEAAAFAAQLTRAELQLERGEPAAALPVLQELLTRDPKHPYVRELLAETYARTGAWEALRQLLSAAEGARALTPARHRDLLARAVQEELARATAGARLDALKSLWESLSPALRALPDLQRAYVRGLARFGADAEAAAQIVRLLRDNWDAALVEAYGELGGLDAVTQLATVEQWLNQHGEKAELLLAAGRVCTRNQLWGKARSYLDAALRLQPSAAAYLALAKLCEQTRHPEEANLFYRRGLELATTKT